jgi:hypothetical protein
MRLHAARAVLRTIINRATSDPTYAERLRLHPVDTLVREGLPYDIIEDFLQETNLQAEVTAHLLPGCANTCALTSPNAYTNVFQAD